MALFFFFVSLRLVAAYRLLRLVTAAAEAAVLTTPLACREHPRAADRGRHQRRHVCVVVLGLREHAEALVAHAAGVRVIAEHLLATIGALLLLVGDGQELGDLRLGDTEGAVDHAEGLLVDAVAELALVCCALHRLPLVGGQEVGAQSERQPLRQVRVAEDAVHLDGVVGPVALVILGVPRVHDVRLCTEHALPPHRLNVESAAALDKAVVALLVGRHVGQAARVVRERLVIVDGLPGEEVCAEGGALALLELLEDGLLALHQHLLELQLQEVGVGLHLGQLLLALALLEELDQLPLTRAGESGQEGIALDALEDGCLRGGEGEGQGAERVHGCCVGRKGGSVPDFQRPWPFKFTSS